MSKPNLPVVIYGARGPDVSPIVMLHRESDGFVTFHRKDAHGRFQNLVAIPAAELRQWFPDFVGQLTEDSYFSFKRFLSG